MTVTNDVGCWEEETGEIEVKMLTIYQQTNCSLTIFSLLVCFIGCSYYSTSTGMIAGIQTVNIPVAESLTAEFGIADRLSERAEEMYIRDGRLRVVDQDGADAILYLTVQNISDEPFSIQKGQRLFQICGRYLEPIHLNLVEELSNSERGNGGFGSTGS